MMERYCLSSDLVQQIEHVKKYGTYSYDLRKGSSLYKWLREKEKKKNTRAVVYDGMVYIFSTDDDTLITVFPVKKRHQRSY